MTFRFLIFSIISIIFFSNSYAQKHIGMWVVRYTMQDDFETAQLKYIAKELKVTDLYVQVRALGKTFGDERTYNSLEDSSKYLKNVSDIVTFGKKNNINIHAWINIFFIHSEFKNNVSSNHLFHTEKDYLLRKVDDNTIPQAKELKAAGLEGHYIDPINNENKIQIKQQIKFLIDSLQVDGIHLDYFRFPNNLFTFSPAGRSAFILDHYIDPVLINDNSDTLTIHQRINIKNQYDEFLEENIKNSLTEINETIKSYHRNIKLSIAVKPDFEIAKNLYYQNWQKWLSENLCDYVVLMNYNADNKIFYNNLEKVKLLNNSEKLVIGIATYNQNNNSVIERINNVLNENFVGYNLFSFNDLRKKANLIKMVKKVNFNKNVIN